MKKSLRNLIIGAIVTAGVFAASSAALAASMQYVQTDMNFRQGPSITAATIGSVPAGAQVEVLDLKDGWNLIRYNGVTGYIHGGNLADTFIVKPLPPKQATAAQTSNSTRDYFDNNWTQTARNMEDNTFTWKTVKVDSGYLALRSVPTYDTSNEIGQLYNGDTVRIDGEISGSYITVYSPKYNTTGWVNAGFLK